MNTTSTTARKENTHEMIDLWGDVEQRLRLSPDNDIDSLKDNEEPIMNSPVMSRRTCRSSPQHRGGDVSKIDAGSSPKDVPSYVIYTTPFSQSPHRELVRAPKSWSPRPRHNSPSPRPNRVPVRQHLSPCQSAPKMQLQPQKQQSKNAVGCSSPQGQLRRTWHHHGTDPRKGEKLSTRSLDRSPVSHSSRRVQQKGFPSAPTVIMVTSRSQSPKGRGHMSPIRHSPPLKIHQHQHQSLLKGNDTWENDLAVIKSFLQRRRGPAQGHGRVEESIKTKIAMMRQQLESDEIRRTETQRTARSL